jgi:hypothetical protein
MFARAATILIVPICIAGYAHHLWSKEQQYWADARALAELRYWRMIGLNCDLGELTDKDKCTQAQINLASYSTLPH